MLLLILLGTSNTKSEDSTLKYSHQVLTLTDENAGLFDTEDDKKVLLQIKMLHHSQRWIRTPMTGGYFQLKSTDEEGNENGKALTWDGSDLKVEAASSTSNGK